MNIFCKVINNKIVDDDSGVSENKADDKAVLNISDEDLKRLFLVEFKSQSYASFYNTSMEKDKSILTLSVGGIGFLVTLINLSKSIGYLDLIIFALAALFFLVSIYCIITMFGKNAEYIVDLTQDRNVEVKDYQLKKLDKIAIYSFYCAIVLSIVLGVVTSKSLVDKGERKVNDKTKIEQLIQSGVKPANESFQNASQLGKSLAGATGLNPQTSAQATTQTSQSANNGSASSMRPDISSDKK